MMIRIHKSHLKQELLTPSVFVGGISISVIYFFLSSLMLNNRFIWETITGVYPIKQKLNLLLALLAGAETMYAIPELLLILTLGFLMGINLVLILKSVHETRVKNIGKKGNLSFGLGVAGLVATTGCASCSVTFLSFIGPSVTAGLLPFHGFFYLQLTSMVLLLISLLYTLNRRNQSCIIAKI